MASFEVSYLSLAETLQHALALPEVRARGRLTRLRIGVQCRPELKSAPSSDEGARTCRRSRPARVSRGRVSSVPAPACRIMCKTRSQLTHAGHRAPFSLRRF